MNDYSVVINTISFYKMLHNVLLRLLLSIVNIY